MPPMSHIDRVRKGLRMTTHAIIGTGKAARALAVLFHRQRLPVMIASRRGVDHAAAMIKDLDACVTAASMLEAFSMDVIFFAVPFPAFESVASLYPFWEGQVIVDMTNRCAAPGAVVEEREAGLSSSELNARFVRGAKLVKAFNSIPVDLLLQPVRADGYRRALLVCSDAPEASCVVAELAFRLGFLAVELGSLAAGDRVAQLASGLSLDAFIKHRRNPDS